MRPGKSADRGVILARLPGFVLSPIGKLFSRLQRRERNTDHDVRAASNEDHPLLFRAIGIDRDYSALDFTGMSVDLQGWGSTHPIFEEVIRESRPSIVIEVGTWKGASLLQMHGAIRILGFDTAFIAVDTWLGSASHWLAADDRISLRLEGGYPTLYRQFIINVIAGGAYQDVYPLPTTSLGAAEILRRLNIGGDLIYLDASHELDDVSADLRLYYDRLRPGGLIFGHDYNSA